MSQVSETLSLFDVDISGTEYLEPEPEPLKPCRVYSPGDVIVFEIKAQFRSQRRDVVLGQFKIGIIERFELCPGFGPLALVCHAPGPPYPCPIENIRGFL